jgi:hypothetical protein
MWREEHRLRVFENREPKKIFGPKKEEVTAEWRILHNEELNEPHSTPNIIRVIKSRRIRWAEHVACMGKMRGAYRVQVGKPNGNRSLGRPRHKWEYNVKIYLQEVEWGHELD